MPFTNVQLMSGDIHTVYFRYNNICAKKIRELLGPIINQDPCLITLFRKVKDEEDDDDDEEELSDYELIYSGENIYAIIRDREEFYFRSISNGRFNLFDKDRKPVTCDLPYGSNIYVEFRIYYSNLVEDVVDYRRKCGYSGYRYELDDCDLCKGLAYGEAVEGYINDILKIKMPECNIYYDDVIFRV